MAVGGNMPADRSKVGGDVAKTVAKGEGFTGLQGEHRIAHYVKLW